eukprot:6129903-Pyramimonas_sp.AAC.1
MTIGVNLDGVDNSSVCTHAASFVIVALHCGTFFLSHGAGGEYATMILSLVAPCSRVMAPPRPSSSWGGHVMSLMCLVLNLEFRRIAQPAELLMCMLGLP